MRESRSKTFVDNFTPRQLEIYYDGINDIGSILFLLQRMMNDVYVNISYKEEADKYSQDMMNTIADIINKYVVERG